MATIHSNISFIDKDRMGLDASLRSSIRELVPDDAFSEHLELDDDGDTNIVKIIDVMASSRGIYSWVNTQGTILTGDILWTHFKRMILRACTAETGVNVTHLVLCVDDAALVPLAKAREQARRKKATKHQTHADKPVEWDPKTQTAVFEDTGLYITPISNKKSMQSTMDKLLSRVNLNINMLCMTSSLRKPLFLYLSQRLSNWISWSSSMAKELPLLKRLCLEYDTGKTVLVYDPYKYNDAKLVELNEVINTKMVFGEADGKIMLWAEHATKHRWAKHIVLDSKDSDVYVWSIHLVDIIKKNGHVLHWITAKEAKDVKTIVNLSKLIPECLKFRPLTNNKAKSSSVDRNIGVHGFAFLCVICGTDFFQKSTAFKHFKVQELINAVCAAQQYIAMIPVNYDRAMEMDNKSKPITLDELQMCMVAVQKVWTFLDYGKIPTSAKYKNKPITDLAIAQIATHLFWNLCYWSYGYKSIPMPSNIRRQVDNSTLVRDADLVMDYSSDDEDSESSTIMRRSNAALLSMTSLVPPVLDESPMTKFRLEDGTLVVRCDEKGMNGLYAGEDTYIPKNALITHYGGILKDKERMAVSDMDTKSHSLSLKGVDAFCVSDGKPYAKLFPKTKDTTNSLFPAKPTTGDKKLDTSIYNSIIRNGVGFMANHSNIAPNCKIYFKVVNKETNKSEPYLRAIHDIAPNEQLTFNYRNNESMMWGLNDDDGDKTQAQEEFVRVELMPFDSPREYKECIDKALKLALDGDYMSAYYLLFERYDWSLIGEVVHKNDRFRDPSMDMGGNQEAFDDDEHTRVMEWNEKLQSRIALLVKKFLEFESEQDIIAESPSDDEPRIITSTPTAHIDQDIKQKPRVRKLPIGMSTQKKRHKSNTILPSDSSSESSTSSSLRYTKGSQKSKRSFV